MFLIYVDESGDFGTLQGGSPERYLVLSGLIVPKLRWRACLNQLIGFRKRMKSKFGLHMREEIHAAHFINKPGNVARIKRHDRLTILRHFADQIAAMPDFRIINVVVDKRRYGAKADIFEIAWETLIQRFDMTIQHGNFPRSSGKNDRGIIFCDNTDARKLKTLSRKMRYFNPVPNQRQYGKGYRNLTIRRIIEDPNHRDSLDSYFIQAADLAAYFLQQRTRSSEDVNKYLKRKGARNYFNRLRPILCRVASSSDPEGIVWR